MPIYEHVVVAEDNSFPGKGGSALEQKLTKDTTLKYNLNTGISSTTTKNRRWLRIATINGANTNAGGYMNFLLSGTGDYGRAARGSILVHFSQRGSNNVGVSAWAWNVENTQTPIELYTQQIGEFDFELWMRAAAFNQTHYLHLMGSERATINADLAGDTGPASPVAQPLTKMTDPADRQTIETALAGKLGTITASSVAGAVGSTPSVAVTGTGDTRNLEFTIPAGDKGDPGDPGATPTVGVGTVATGAEGSTVSVTEGGTATARTFNFTIPRGNKGDPGTPGTNGTTPTVGVGTVATGEPGTAVSVTEGGTATARTFNFTIPKGDKGDKPTLGLLSTVTNDPGTAANVTHTLSGTTDYFKFYIPRGDKGADGESINLKGLGALYAGYTKRTTLPVGIVFTGSSTTEGSDQTPSDRWVNKLIARMQTAFPSGSGESAVGTHATPKITTPGIHGYNAGLSGTTSANYLTDTKITQIGDIDPLVVSHMVGSNDYHGGMAPATYKANLIGWLNKLDGVVASPYVNLLIHAQRRTDLATYAYSWDAYGQILKELANERANCVFLDVSKEFDTAGIASGDPLDVAKPDNVHLTIDGHDMMHRVIAEALQVPASGSSNGAGTSIGLAQHILTSDTFGTSRPDVHNKPLDAIMGGRTGFNWQSDPATADPTTTTGYLTVSGGTLSQVSTTGAFVACVSHNYPDMQMDMQLVTLPGNEFYIVGRRWYNTVANSPNDYRLIIKSDGSMTMAKRSSGTVTTLASTPAGTIVAGNRVALRFFGTNIKVVVAGVVVMSVDDSTFNGLPSGWYGFSGTGTSKGWSVDNLVFSTVVS